MAATALSNEIPWAAHGHKQTNTPSIAVSRPQIFDSHAQLFWFGCAHWLQLSWDAPRNSCNIYWAHLLQHNGIAWSSCLHRFPCLSSSQQHNMHRSHCNRMILVYRYACSPFERNYSSSIPRETLRYLKDLELHCSPVWLFTFFTGDQPNKIFETTAGKMREEHTNTTVRITKLRTWTYICKSCGTKSFLWLTYRPYFWHRNWQTKAGAVLFDFALYLPATLRRVFLGSLATPPLPGVIIVYMSFQFIFFFECACFWLG